MRTLLIWTLILWLALILENSRPDLFPSCSLVIPTAVSCMFRLRNSAATILAGATLLIRWLLHPTMVPAEVFAVLICTALLLARQTNAPGGLPATSSRRSASVWMPHVAVTVAALLCHTFVEADMLLPETVSLLTTRIIISGPYLGVMLFAALIADEFGLQRLSHSA